MATHSPPFSAATAGRANQVVAGEAMTTSRKLITVLAFATVYSIFLIAIFVMNIMWAPACNDKTEENTDSSSGEGDGGGEEKKSSGTTKGAAFRNYTGFTVSAIMLATLIPGFYFANAV